MRRTSMRVPELFAVAFIAVQACSTTLWLNEQEKWIVMAFQLVLPRSSTAAAIGPRRTTRLHQQELLLSRRGLMTVRERTTASRHFVTTPQQEQQENVLQEKQEQRRTTVPIAVVPPVADEPENENSKKKKKNRSTLSKLVHIYTDYASRLWDETSLEARERMTATRRLAATTASQQELLWRMQQQQQTNDSATNTTILANGGGGAAASAVDNDGNINNNSKNSNIIINKDIELDLSSSIIPTSSSSGGTSSSIVVVDDDLATATGAAVAVITTTTRTKTTMGSTLITTPITATAAAALAVLGNNNNNNNKKPRRSIAFGAAMGLVVTTWVFSGNYIFTLLFTLMTILGQLEYYRMVMSTGVYPARRISIVGACSMFLTALFTPDLHQICLPLFGCWTMIWFLTMKRTPSTIPEIATTFTGMFYLGYVPSFWVRLRIMGSSREPTRLASIAGPVLRYLHRQGQSLPRFVPSAIHLPVTSGAIFIFWTWLCLAFNDVGAYFVGRKLGRTKLGIISPAAAATSPNKTIEGLIGGCTVSALLAIFGAWVQRWPYPVASGAVHGIVLGLLGLIGDLSASMLKRDAGIKDFGDLIPEHGGIMDRVDGFIWTAPYSWLVYSYVLPALRAVAAR